MLKKLTNKKGFTLMEMLIVVAIIAVLVAVAIPTFNGALNKARVATDAANIRAAYAEASVEYLNGIANGTEKPTVAEKSVVTTGTTDGKISIAGKDYEWKNGKTAKITVNSATGEVTISGLDKA